MEFSRRSVLRLGALTCASATSPAWARSLGMFAPAGTGPAADSVLVLVEGPWLYTQPVTGTLRCISLSDPHQCQMGLWDTASSSMVSPYDHSAEGPMLANGASFVGKLSSGNARPDVVKIFDAAFYRDDVGGPDNFVYLRNTGLKATAKSTDRTVTVPVPDNVYVAGRITNGLIKDASQPPIIVNPDTARIFVTYVFEYTQDATGSTSLTFDDGTGKTFTLTKGQHLLFQMQAKVPTTADVPHIVTGFSDLVSRVSTGTIPLSVDFGPGTASAEIQLGVNAQGLTPAELGLHVNTIAGHKMPAHRPAKHDRLKTDKDPSCQGGGFPILP